MAGIICNENGYACDNCGRTAYALVAAGGYDLCWACTNKYALELVALSVRARDMNEKFAEEYAARIAGEGI